MWGDGIFIRNPTGRGLLVHSAYVLITHNTFDNNRHQGISIVDGSNITVTGNITQNTNGSSPQSGIDIEPNGTYDVVDGVTVSNNQFLANYGWGFTVNGNLGPVSHVTVSNNTAVGNGFDGIQLYKVSSALVNDNNLKANGLRALAGYGHGIYVVTTTQASVTGNKVLDTRDAGIVVVGLSQNCNIQSNVVLNACSDGIVIAATSDGKPDNFTVSNNIVSRSGGNGISTYGTASGQILFNKAIASSQLKTHTYDGIRLHGASAGVSVINNLVNSGGLTNGTRYGLAMIGCYNCTAALNDLGGREQRKTSTSVAASSCHIQTPIQTAAPLYPHAYIKVVRVNRALCFLSTYAVENIEYAYEAITHVNGDRDRCLFVADITDQEA